MIKKLKETGRFKITLLLAIFSLFSVLLSAFRIWYTENIGFIFLNWNLFLAFIPFAISSLLIVHNINKKRTLILLLFTWILFFPNAPYILTDLFHLNGFGDISNWFDLGLILSYAWTGLLFGLVSLFDIENIISKRYSDRVANYVSVFILFLSAFGVYIGRFLRWNSWDIIQNPLALFSDIFSRFINPSDHPRTWGMTLLLGLVLNMFYFTIKYFKNDASNLKAVKND